MKKEREDNKMDNNTKFFWLMRKQSLEEELKYQKTLRELIQNNKDRNEDVWDEDEAEKTAWVLTAIDQKIDELEKEINETPSLE